MSLAARFPQTDPLGRAETEEMDKLVAEGVLTEDRALDMLLKLRGEYLYGFIGRNGGDAAKLWALCLKEAKE